MMGNPCDLRGLKPKRDSALRRVPLQRILLAAAIWLCAAAASGWQIDPRNAARFENPPLLYEGPDPTANFFLPSAGQWAAGQPGEPPIGVVGETMPPFNGPQQQWLGAPGWSGDLAPGLHEGLSGNEVVSCGVTDFKDGFFQKLGVTWTWIDRRKPDEHGLHEFDSFVMVAVPAPSRAWPLLISPTFNARLLDGPTAPDLPAQLYEGYIDFMWLPRLSPRWTGIIGVAPSYYGDFQVDPEDAFRLTGKGLARFDWIPDRLQLLFGVLYLNRNDVKLLPAGGFIWTPHDAKRYELLFPKPKLAHRITVGGHYEDWVYLGAEFGGNTYAVERVGGTLDFVTLRDIRAYVGLERKMNGGAGYRIEIGYVFARRVEYDSITPDIEADDTAMLRAGFTY